MWLDQCLQACEQNQALPSSGDMGLLKCQVKIKCLKGVWGSSVWEGTGEGWYRWWQCPVSPLPGCARNDPAGPKGVR